MSSLQCVNDKTVFVILKLQLASSKPPMNAKSGLLEFLRRVTFTFSFNQPALSAGLNFCWRQQIQ